VASNEDGPQEGGGSVSSGEQKSEPEPTETAEAEPEEEPQSEPSSVEKKEPEAKTEQPKKVAEKKTEKPKIKTEKKQEAKQKAASKIVKKMGDKGRYDDSNQLKTLVVMQVLGNTKTFFDNQVQLPDTQNFFDGSRVPDAQITDNNAAAYFMIGGSDVKMDALTDMQYRR
jgi:outer membrane biosynthesis protein TonB